MKEKQETELVAVRMPVDLKNKLKKLAEKENRTLSNYIINSLLKLTEKTKS